MVVSNPAFSEAKRLNLKLRMAISGGPKMGKTYTALMLALALAKLDGDGRVAVIDTEHRAASKYAGISPCGMDPWNFDVSELAHFSPKSFAGLIASAGASGYQVIVIDSLSHAWMGTGGALAQVDAETARTGNSFTAWGKVTPGHNSMIEAILSSPAHIIATMRSKIAYELQKSSEGKMIPIKLGMAPVQRNDTEYEFDVWGQMDRDHTMTIEGSRCSAVDGTLHTLPGPDLMAPIFEWLNEGAPPAAKPNVMMAPLSAAPIINPLEQLPMEICTDAQVDEILHAAHSTGMRQIDFFEHLHSLGVHQDTLSHLTSRKAQELIQHFKNCKTAMEAAKRF